MAKFDVFRLANGALVLDCQADLLGGLNTRMVVPLVAQDDATTPIRRLNPVVPFDGQRYVIQTQFMASVPIRELGQAIGSLEQHEAAVSSALDMLFVGF